MWSVDGVDAGDEISPACSARAGGPGDHRLAARRLSVVAGLADPEPRWPSSLHAASERAKSLAADLQNLQKAAGTAADLKAQATEAEKALSDASAARASAQNELADLTKQINDAKLAISGAQEEASAKTRDLQAVDAELKEESDRLAGLAEPGPGLVRRSDQAAGPGRRRAAALAEAQSQTAAAQKQLETLQNQINAATAELNALQSRSATPSAGRARRSDGGRDRIARTTAATTADCRARRACYKLAGRARERPRPHARTRARRHGRS